MLKILQLSKRAFWDVNMDTLDEETHADWMIVRVFEKGTLDDLIEIWAFYGNDRVKKALLNASYLSEQVWYFAASLFKLNTSDFKCYTTKQFHPIARSYSAS